jgi:hypothetical protein
MLRRSGCLHFPSQRTSPASFPKDMYSGTTPT